MSDPESTPRQLPLTGGFSLPQSELLHDVARLLQQLDEAVEGAKMRSEQFRAAGDELGADLASADFHAQMYSRAIQIFAGMTVEATVNLYGLMRFSEKVYEERFERLPVVPRLRALVREATGKELAKDEEIVLLASALMARRNAHAHMRGQESSPDESGTFQTVTQRPQPERHPSAGYKSAAELSRFVELFPRLDPTTSFIFLLPMLPDPAPPLDKYLQQFRGTAQINTRAEAALKNALDIRKFEIDLYWKRSAYFWAFIAAAFAGYFIVLKSDANAPSEILFAINCLGFTFSVGWYFANRGSKFWQENWEQHVDLLEDEVTGPLYKTVIDRKQYPFRRLFGPFAFSLSKLNTILSLYVSAIWLFLGGRSLSFVWRINEPFRGFNLLLLSVLTVGAIVLLYRNGRTGEPASRILRFTRRVVGGVVVKPVPTVASEDADAAGRDVP